MQNEFKELDNLTASRESSIADTWQASKKDGYNMYDLICILAAS